MGWWTGPESKTWAEWVGAGRERANPSLHNQVQFFKLMDDIADIYFMGINGSSIGRHHVAALFSHRLQEDNFACTCVPSLGGYGIAELEPFESQSRGFQHGHRKVYKIPATREQDVVRLFREQDQTVLRSLLQKLRQAMISCAESLQYEASTLPAAQMKQAVLPEKFTKKQQLQSRLDGGVELDGSCRQLLETTPQELPGHHVLEHRRAHAEQRPPLSVYSQVSLQGCHQSLMPTYRLPQKTFDITSLDEVGMASDDQRAEALAVPLHWCTGDEGDHVVGVAHAKLWEDRAEQPALENVGGSDGAEQPVSVDDYVADANAFALSYCRDFRALHQLNHDHDCTSTCVKYVPKNAKQLQRTHFDVAGSLLVGFSSSTSSSLRAALYSLPPVLDRRPSSAFAGEGRNLSRRPTSLAPMTVTSSVRSFWCGTHPFDQRRRTSDKCGAAAILTFNSCLVSWIPTGSSHQRCLLAVLHKPQINRRSSHRRIPNSLWRCTVCGYSSLVRPCCGDAFIR